jgi:CRP-like cAMP-binding protein
MSSKSLQPPGDNSFLRAISPKSLAALRPYLEHLLLPRHYILSAPGSRKAPFVYFLSDGMASLVVESEDGRSPEVGAVGKEGMTGIPAVLGVPYAPITEIMQIPGDGFRMYAASMTRMTHQHTEIRDLVCHHMGLLSMQIAQIAGCNALHSAEQRLARWLLMAQDRDGTNPLPLTQDMLAGMLGITRPTVSVVLNLLQKKGCIAVGRERVEIRNRKLLEQFSCRCYGVLSAMRNRARS